jgi:hypothetical protein
MKKILLLLIFMFSSLTHASFNLNSINWNRLTKTQKANVWLEYRSSLKELNKLEPEKVSWMSYSFIQEAYANSFDCFVAGWPSSKSSQGKCLSPIKENPSYLKYMGCPADKILCNPTLFGDGLCINFKSLKERNFAFDQCEKKFSEEGRLYSDVLEQVDSQEMNDLLSTFHQKCSSQGPETKNVICQKLHKKLQFFIPYEQTVGYEDAKKNLVSVNPDDILSSIKTLQKELEEDSSDFKRVCENGIEITQGIYCKNLAIRIKKSTELIPQLIQRLDKMNSTSDCVNCSSTNATPGMQVQSLTVLEVAKEASCTDEEKKKNSSLCNEEVMCSIASTVFTGTIGFAEMLGLKPQNCLSSQNSCVTNIISTLVESLLSLVTGIWDLLGHFVDWTKDKLNEFWNYVSQVEDKTSDAQHLINNMSENDLKQVQDDPIQWITNLAGNMWQGLKQWMKDDIFCEKWSGFPRKSQCLQPSSGFECMSCRTMISGTCSVAGVVLAEILPAFISGGTACLVARAASGADEFAAFIKASQSYNKMVTAVDKLGDVNIIKFSSRGGEAISGAIKSTLVPLNMASKLTLGPLSKSFKVLVESKAFKSMSQKIDSAAKYTGINSLTQFNSKVYSEGFEFVDSALKINHSVSSLKTAEKMLQARKISAQIQNELQPLYKDINLSYKNGDKLRLLDNELKVLKRLKNPSTVEANRILQLTDQIEVLNSELTDLNNKFINMMNELLKKDGIPSNIIKGEDGSLVLSLDFSSEPTGKYAFEFYRRVKNRFGANQVILSLKDNASMGFAGYFKAFSKTIDMGPRQGLSLLDDYVNTVTKHESRHLMFFSKRAHGDDSIFHVNFYASSDGNLLNAHGHYDEFMNAEEIYTYSTDLQSYAQILKADKVVNLNERNDLIYQIEGHVNDFKNISTSSREITKEMINSLDDILKNTGPIEKCLLEEQPNGNFSFIFSDRLNRKTQIELVDAEEKLLAKSFLTLSDNLNLKMENAFVEKMKEDKFDLNSLANRIQSNQLTQADTDLILKFQSTYMQSPDGIAGIEQLNSALAPLIKNARDNMVKLNQISSTQITETENLSRLINIYADKEKGGQDFQLKALRDSLFKMGKNVKEDFKANTIPRESP